MARFSRATVIDAPLAAVWEFHSRIDGLQALTPRWMGLEVQGIRRPTTATGDALVVGSDIWVKTRPFGILPGSNWLSRIVEREYASSEAVFRDEMLEGPFTKWLHTHRFVDLGYGTLVHDDIEYALPIPGSATIAKPALAALFAYRHRRTKQLLESQ